MDQLGNNALTRLRERAFTIQEEANGDVSEEFRMWHKLRPMLLHRNALAHGRAPGKTRTGGDSAP